MMDFYIIIFPGGNRSKIEVASCYRYELKDYALASREKYAADNEEEAFAYARKLAKDNNKEYVPQSWEDTEDDNDYLD